MSRIHQLAFHALCTLGAPIGGIRPRRIYHWLARRGFHAESGTPELRWYRDRWGFAFELHPHYLIDRSIIAFGGYEIDLLRFLRDRLSPGMVCLDVGANLGQITVHMASRTRPGGCVHAFEPVPHVRERLLRNLARNGLDDTSRVHAVALSDAAGTATMRIADPAVSNQGMGSLVTRGNVQLGQTIEVPTMRLDDFVEQQRIPRVDWMKIDIQGAEPLLLAGAVRTLERCSPRLILEVSPEDLAGGGVSSRDLVATLDGLGYRMHELRGRRLGPRLRPRDVGPDFAADNLFCTKDPADAT